MKLIGGVFLAALSTLFTNAYAEQINVAVAANFMATMTEIVTEFERSSGHRVSMSFGSSGKFFAQIQYGAPFHVFFSADQAKPQALEQAGLAVPGSRFTYAIGALALWSRKPDVVDQSAALLINNNFNKLALANPMLAPYGAATVDILNNLELTKSTRTKWVQGENITQAYQFVSTGNADIGFIALSQIMVKGRIQRGSAWIVPTQLYPAIRQDAVLLKRGKNSKAAKSLLRFMRSDTSTQIIKSYGYKVQGLYP